MYNGCKNIDFKFQKIKILNVYLKDVFKLILNYKK